jgi:cytochrome P450
MSATATTGSPAANGNAASAGSPPSIRMPKPLQTARFIVRPVSFLEAARGRYGQTFSASLFGPGELTMLSDPPSIKKLFAADRVNTIAPGRNIVLGPILGSGSLLLQQDDEHMRRRRLMLPSFHGDRMRAYAETVAEATERAIASWPAAGGEEFALHPSMQEITLEVILRAVFGIEDSERRRELSSGLVAVLTESAGPAAFGLMMPGVRDLPHYRHFRRKLAETDALLAQEIADCRADPKLSEREDILSMMVSARFDDGEAMSDRELRDQLMTLLLAGHETTATALAWTFDLLLHDDRVMNTLQNEVDAGESTEYLDAVISESLRIRPVVPMTGRELREDSELGGYVLPSGSIVMASIYLAHTRQDVYGDPYAFRPERFIEGETETFSWIPFGGGTRRCIGAAFAQMEMRIAIETILRSARLEAARPGLERPTRRSVTLSPREGTIVRRLH